MKVLYLHLKKKWFDMFASGEKLEEYRDDTPYWQKRLIDKSGNLKQYDCVIFLSGYPEKGCENRILSFAYPQIRMGEGKPEWGAIHGKTYFVITPGTMLHQNEAICEGCKRIYNEKKNYGICPHCHYDNIFG